MAISSPTVNHSREDKDLVLRVGSFEIDWPKVIGDFGGIWLAVAYDVIAPPLGLFIAAIPILKLLKHPDQPRSVRIVSDVLEGAAKPVGGDSETTVRLAQAGRSRRAAHRSKQDARRKRVALGEESAKLGHELTATHRLLTLAETAGTRTKGVRR
jgi:hypothetical protein